MTKPAFKFVCEADGTIPVSSAVYQALGAASVAWSETPRGEFDARFALEIGEALLKVIEAEGDT